MPMLDESVPDKFWLGIALRMRSKKRRKREIKKNKGEKKTKMKINYFLVLWFGFVPV